jgi:hypothetical protein
MADDGAPATITPEMIERFRQVGLRLDRNGRLWHEDVEVTHPGLRRAILRWLDVRDDGRAIVRLDERRYAYIDVEDAHLQVTSLRWDGEVPIAHLDDGREEPLACATLSVGDGGAIYVRVRDGRLRARLSTAAQQHLADHLVDDGDRIALRAAGALWPLAATAQARSG